MFSHFLRKYKITKFKREIQVFRQWKKTTPYLSGIWSYVQGSAFVATGELALAQAELAKLEILMAASSTAGNRAGATATREIVALAAYGLRGEIQLAMGELEGAIASFEFGVALEDTNNYTEPPDWSQSVRLYLGAALLEAGPAVEAEEVYRKDLEWNQRNGWTTFGLYQALEAQGKDQEAIIVNRQFEELWRNADVELERSRL